MKEIFNKLLIKHSIIRALYTIGETFLATIPTSAVVLSDVNWLYVVSSSLLAGLISFVKSILIGLPEVKDE